MAFILNHHAPVTFQSHVLAQLAPDAQIVHPYYTVEIPNEDQWWFITDHTTANNALGLQLHPPSTDEEWAEEDIPVPSAPRLRPIDLPEVETHQGHDGLGTNTNNLPAEHVVVDFDVDFDEAGQIPMFAQGDIFPVNPDVPQEEPLIAPASYAATISQELYGVADEFYAHDGYGEQMLFAHPDIDFEFFDEVMLQWFDDMKMEAEGH